MSFIHQNQHSIKINKSHCQFYKNNEAVSQRSITKQVSTNAYGSRTNRLCGCLWKRLRVDDYISSRDPTSFSLNWIVFTHLFQSNVIPVLTSSRLRLLSLILSFFSAHPAHQKARKNRQLVFGTIPSNSTLCAPMPDHISMAPSAPMSPPMLM